MDGFVTCAECDRESFYTSKTCDFCGAKLPDSAETLRTTYTEMSYSELVQIKENAVLREDAQKVLLEVLKSKETEHFKSEVTTKRIEEAQASGDYSSLTPAEIEYLTKRIVVTTETAPVGIDIERRLDVITAECVYGMNIFRDVFVVVRDFFGGRSGAAQKVLRDARKVSLAELKREALMLGADAIVGVRLDYSEVTGGGKSQMLMIVASGTAVTTKS